ncbi:unnamed protein product [Musa hybrid cultivar]
MRCPRSRSPLRQDKDAERASLPWVIQLHGEGTLRPSLCMERGQTRREGIKPLVLKLAIPLALPLVGFIFSTITRKCRTRNRAPSSASSREGSLTMDSSESVSLYESEDEESSRGQEEAQRELVEHCDPSEVVRVQCPENLEGEIESLKCLVSAMDDRASEAESQFQDYRDAKEKESLFQKLQIMCLGFQLECLETRNQRLEATIADQQTALEKLEEMRAELKWLRREGKKLAKVDGLHLHEARRQARILGAREAELSQIKEELRYVKDLADHLQEEKKALDQKMDSLAAKYQSASEIEEDGNMRMASNKEFLDQLEQFRHQWYLEMEELIYIGWVGACLRHEPLMDQEEQLQEIMELPADDEAEARKVELHDSSAIAETGHGACLDAAARKNQSGSKKPRLLHKLKGWAKGGKGVSKQLRDS